MVATSALTTLRTGERVGGHSEATLNCPVSGNMAIPDLVVEMPKLRRRPKAAVPAKTVDAAALLP
jgi:hypothetical protein